MFSKTFTILAFLFLAFAVFAPARAQDKPLVGAVKEVEGTGAILRHNTAIYQDMVVKMDVYMKDFIKTRADSRAVILFIDDTELTLGADTALIIDEYVFYPDAMDRNKGRFSVMRGTFLFVSGLISKKDDPDVRIDTPYGWIGIRGTTIWAGPLDGKYAVLVLKGEITFNTDIASVIVPEGHGIFIVDRQSTPSKPEIWPAERIDRVLKTVALESKELEQPVEQHGGNQKEPDIKSQKNRDTLPSLPPLPAPMNFHMPSGSY